MTKRYAMSGSDAKGLTLGELKDFIVHADAMSFDDNTRIRVKAKLGSTQGAKIKEISVDNQDRVKDAP